MGQTFCNCNNKGDNTEVYYYIDESKQIDHNDYLNNVQMNSLKDCNFPTIKEKIIKMIYLNNAVKKFTHHARIYFTLRKNMRNVNLVIYITIFYQLT